MLITNKSIAWLHPNPVHKMPRHHFIHHCCPACSQSIPSTIKKQRQRQHPTASSPSSATVEPMEVRRRSRRRKEAAAAAAAASQDNKKSKQEKGKVKLGECGGDGVSASPSLSPKSGGRSKSPASRSRSADKRRTSHRRSKSSPEEAQGGSASSSEEGEVHSESENGAGKAGKEAVVVRGEGAVEEEQEQLNMSVAETNKVRLKLGLKPLNMGGENERKEKEKEAHRKRKEADKVEDPRVIRERLQDAKKRRRVKEALEGVKGLGEASSEEEDLEDWVEKSRKMVVVEREEEVKGEEMEGDEDLNAQDLAGLKVRHGADEIEGGETMILTLADQPILDDKGMINEAEDELENAVRMQEKQRRKAYEDSKPKKEFNDEGARVSMWDKYDEEEQEAALVLTEKGGASEVNAKMRSEEIRGKLMVGLQSASVTVPSDFYTPEEAAVMRKPGKKKRKKLRQKPAVSGKNMAAELDKTSKAGYGAEDWNQDHGSRRSQIARLEETARLDAERIGSKVDRFEHALSKANKAAAKLRVQPQTESDVKPEVDSMKMDVDHPKVKLENEDLAMDNEVSAMLIALKIFKNGLLTAHHYGMLVSVVPTQICLCVLLTWAGRGAL